jgi:hypothetical protein
MGRGAFDYVSFWLWPISMERTPLLNEYSRPPQSFYQKTLSLFKTEGEPSWLDSYRWFLLRSWLNFLLLLAPVAAAAHHLQWDALLRFGFSFVAIIPLAKVCRTSSRTCQDLHGVPSYLAMRRSRCLSLLGRLLPDC